MIEAMLAGLRIDGHAANGIKNLPMICVNGVTVVMIIRVCGVSMCLRSFAARTRSARCAGR
jgi:hypothetical protein